MDLTLLTERQRMVLRLRHERGWTLERIGRRMGIARPTVWELLQRAELRAGIASPKRQVRVPKWRVVRPSSLSSTFNY